MNKSRARRERSALYIIRTSIIIILLLLLLLFFFQYLQSTFNLQNKQIVMFENHNDRQWLVYVKSVRIGSRHY